MGRKRKNGEGTVRLRKDGRWEGRVVIGYDDRGLPRTKSVLAKTKGECVEKLKVLRESVAPTASNKLRTDMPFGDWLEYWFENCCKPETRPSSHRSYEGHIRVYLKPKLGSIPLNKLTQNDLQRLYNWMAQDGRTEHRELYGSGLSPAVVRNCASLSLRALAKAAEEKLITVNPAEGCKLPPVRRPEMKTLSREEMQKVLIQAKEEQYYEAFLLELCTGLRQGELVALRWDDLNFDTGELRINKQATVVNGQLMITEPKTKAAVRTLILPPAVVRALRERREHVRSSWMFPSPKKEGLPIKPQTVRQRLERILKHTGCRKVRFHDLRHTFATNALEHGMDVKTLSTIIGHVSSATTLNVYAHVTDDMKRQAAAKIDRGIAGADLQKESKRPEEEHSMTTFLPRKRWQREVR